MKIIYLHQYFVTPNMAGGTRSYEMARRFTDWGHEVHMITSKRTGGNVKREWKKTEESGIHVHWYPVAYSNKMGFKERVKAFLKFSYVSAGKAVSLDGDVVFATSTPLTIALPGIYASKKLKLPFVFEVRDLWPELPIAIGALQNKILIKAARALERVAYNSAKHVVALSPGMREGVVKTGYPAEKVSVIPNSCDIQLFNVAEEKGKTFRFKHKWLQERPLVVYTGTLGTINGVGYLADIAAEAKKINPEVRFLIVGDGIERDKIEEKAVNLGILNKNFFMFNKVAKKEMPDILSAADMATSLFIDLEEMWANSANKFFDALASGTPPAINYGGWQAQLLQKENAGLMLHPNNTKKAAKDLVLKITDEKWLERAGSNARKLAKSNFNRDKLARDLLDILEKVAKK